MIVLRNLTKIYSYNRIRKAVLRDINVTFPSGKAIGLLGRNGAGKTTLMKVIAGLSLPTWGEVLTDGDISFPIGIAGSVHPNLTGAQNVRFVARLYGADTDALQEFVQDFAELGHHFYAPVRSYSSGMRSRLSFGINMGLTFDTYLVDEATAAGDASFVEKSRALFAERMRHAGAIFVSHSTTQIRAFCESGAVLERGRLTYFDDLDEAIWTHERNLGIQRKPVTVP